MKQIYNVKGKSVDEAYRKAVELYSSLGDISLEEVVNPGKKGFLGLFGAVDAEIKISVDDGITERKPKIKKPQQNNQNSQNNQNNQNKNQPKQNNNNQKQNNNQNQPSKKQNGDVKDANKQTENKQNEKKNVPEKKVAPVKEAKENYQWTI